MAVKSKSKNSRKKTASKTCKTPRRSMNITSRIVDIHRHTKGYTANGRNYTVSQMRKFVASGNVSGVQVVGRYIQACPGSPRLKDLPVKVSRSMNITSRIVDIHRHTKGYTANGRNYTVSQMRKFVASGNVPGVQVVGRYIQACPGSPRLKDLPVKVAK